jgi:hypothetical protein
MHGKHTRPIGMLRQQRNRHNCMHACLCRTTVERSGTPCTSASLNAGVDPEQVLMPLHGKLIHKITFACD